MGMVCSLIAVTANVAAQRHSPDRYLKVAATGTKLDGDGKQTVTITMAIKKGYSVYANPVKNELFGPVETVVSVSSKVNLAGLEVQYPPGNMYRDKFIPELSLMIYEGDVSISAQVRRAPGDTGPLVVEVRFTVRAEVCLPPMSVKITIP
jgi:DsbC/DsbD-like thiol-disulfide interchange protein